MPEPNQTEGDSSQPKKANRNPFRAAKTLFKSLPVGLRRILVSTLAAFLIIVGIAVLHPSLNERWKFGTDMTLNLLILFAIAVQAYIYTKQREVMQRQAEHMVGQVEMAKGQLVALQHQEQVLFASQRAYVTAKIRGTGEGSHQWRLRIENSGNTPANNVCVYYSAEFGEDPPWDMQAPPFRQIPEEQIIFDTALMETARLGVIAPNSSYHIIRTPKVDPLSGEDRKKWIHGDIKFFCWGVVIYEDIFNEKRHTYFCFFESQKHPTGYPCEHGNRAT